ncbi:Alcohol dehydrogenase superfamily zinc-containing [Botryosphaeria dothidea]|uniref:Alcohol dehydrogenase superfamily zinc-containing n=1 Tax=Botryosphaeria dothidea TaxID=55169 RepID=A0A8H4J783_9PEZI|nr:Alcohol dehydrogenase superfamily zinc-containing [Botryosphaeria dothidea]
MATPTSAKAQVVRLSAETPRLALDQVAVPEVGPGNVLVHVDHVAQNPTDVQSFDSNAFGDGTVLGCDFTGVVRKVGDRVTRLKEGDNIAGLIWGGEKKGVGAYSQYTIADERISFKIPKGTSPDQAATVPLAAATAWLAMFSKESLNIPRAEASKNSILIWGGSSSVGQFAIQEAAKTGLTVITTCSPKHFDLVKSYGAKHAFDYNSGDVIEQIKSVAPELKYVFDTIGTKSSSGSASQAVSGKGGKLCTVRPGKANTEDVVSGIEVSDVLVWTAFLKEHRYGEFYWPPSKDDHELSAELFEKLPEWLETGVIKPNATRVLAGLESVPKGFDMHRNKEISGFKIVYKVE